METNFTKGKWTYTEPDGGICANGDLIASTWQQVHPSQKIEDGETWLDMRIRTEVDRIAAKREQLANARLISASPEMFIKHELNRSYCFTVMDMIDNSQIEPAKKLLKIMADNSNYCIKKAI